MLLIVMKLLLLPHLSGSPAVRLPSEGESSSCPIHQYRLFPLRTGSSDHLGIPPSFSQHTNIASSLLRVLCSPERHWSPMLLPCLLKSLAVVLSLLIPSYHHYWRIPFASASVCLPKYLLAQPSVGHLPPYATTMGPVSAPHPCTMSTTLRLWIWGGGPLTVPL